MSCGLSVLRTEYGVYFWDLDLDLFLDDRLGQCIVNMLLVGASVFFHSLLFSWVN